MKKKLQILTSLLLAAGLIWWVFRGTDWAEVGAALRNAHWGWLVFSVGVVLVSFYLRVRRWSYIVRTAGPVSFRSMFSATQIGFLGNFVLPARVGELIRALVLGRLAKLPVAQCFAFVVLDRVTDLFGLLCVFLVAAVAFQPPEVVHAAILGDIPEWAAALLEPGAIRGAALTCSGILVVIMSGFVLLYVKQQWVILVSDAVVGKVSTRLAERLRHLFLQFAEGMHVFRSVGDLSKALAFSLATWGTFLLSYCSLMWTFDIHPPWYVPFVLVSMLSVAISLPSTPGFAGVFHFAIFFSVLFTMPETDANVARALAIVAHLVNLIPVVVVGIFCLYLEDLGLFQLQRESRKVQASSETSA
jgi:glycosyltransferase 2 family protein